MNIEIKKKKYILHIFKWAYHEENPFGRWSWPAAQRAAAELAELANSQCALALFWRLGQNAL